MTLELVATRPETQTKGKPMKPKSTPVPAPAIEPAGEHITPPVAVDPIAVMGEGFVMGTPPTAPPATPAAAASLSDPPDLTPLVSTPADDAPESVDPVLVRILSWKRGHGTTSEGLFLSWLHDEIKSRGAKSEVKSFGCITTTIPRHDGKVSSTLFSCHVDTVNSSQNPKPQKIIYDPSFGHVFLDKDDPDAGTCLGADDGAGVWLMLEMIKAKVPGGYIFHRGEECGGLGSKEMLAKNRAWLEQFDCAVAFDRADNDEVITHQGGMRCASDKFGAALCKALNDSGQGFKYQMSNRGVFTDTKNYRGAVAECVNIGVGYHAQHSKQETLDYGHLVKLRNAAVAVNWDALPIDRDPKYVEPWTPPARPAWAGNRSQYGFGDFGAYGRYEDYDDYPKGRKAKGKAKPKGPAPKHEQQLDLFPEQELLGMPYDDVSAFCEDDPGMAAGLLIDLAAEVAALRAKVDFLRGALRGEGR